MEWPGKLNHMHACNGLGPGQHGAKLVEYKGKLTSLPEKHIPATDSVQQETMFTLCSTARRPQVIQNLLDRHGLGFITRVRGLH